MMYRDFLKSKKKYRRKFVNSSLDWKFYTEKFKNWAFFNKNDKLRHMTSYEQSLKKPSIKNFNLRLIEAT